MSKSITIRVCILGCAIFLSFLPVPSLVAFNYPAGVKVLASSFGGLTIEFSPQDWRVDSLSINGEWYKLVYFSEASFEGQEGAPQLPVKIAVIGIPQGTQIRYTILESRFRDIANSLLLPRPELVREDGIAEERYFPDEKIYSSNGPYPQYLVQLEQPAYLRDQYITRIHIYPVQFFPGKRTIRQYDKIVIRIDFLGGQKPRRLPEVSRKEEELYRSAVLNYSQARYWRKESQRELRKAVSPFSTGEWYKIAIQDEGIYKLDGNTLSGQGIDIAAIDPKSIRIYNNGGRELPRELNAARPDNLIENAILVVDGNDGSFDASDYILFYGKSVENWNYSTGTGQFTHYINHYTRENIYWLTFGGGKQGKRMAERASLPDQGLSPQTQFIDHVFVEEDINNMFASGYNWFGRLFTNRDARNYGISLSDAIPSAPTLFKFRFVGRTVGYHQFDIYINESFLTSSSFSGITFNEISVEKSELIKDGTNNLRFEYQSTSDETQAYMDWFEVHYYKSFKARNNTLLFTASSGSGVAKYHITGFSGDDIQVFDITDFSQVKRITGAEIANGSITFVDSLSTQSPRRYLALTPATYKSVTSLEKDESSDLRNPNNSADFIIITHDDFYEQALPLKTHRQERDSLETIVVKISDVYDEFSWGLLDPTAIRDFLKYAYHYWAKKPAYVLLCGDGDYDYKNIISTQDENWIPPYETSELNSNSTRATDDWFTFVSGDDQIMDMAIGRLTVRSAEETQHIIEKIIQYETNPIWGDWRNTLTMVGDDELVLGGKGDETMHTRDAEYIAEHILPSRFNIKKIYLSEYPAVPMASISGVMKPAATEALLEQINRGTLIVNFIGHGAPSLWAHERLLEASRDFDLIQNDMKLAFWIAATCDFGRFDDPLEQSMTEELLAAEKRGAIGLLTSARLAYASDNTALNRAFYKKLFIKPNQTRRLGRALMLAKLQTSSYVNNQKYHLFGDPAMYLAAPRYSAIITSVVPDTIKALSRIKILGQVQKESSLWRNFQGKVLLKAFDSKKRKTHTTAAGSVMSYWLPGSTIFRGTASISEGEFEVRFIVPKDITYGGNLGRLSVYFWNNDVDGNGYQDSIQVGGTATNLTDTQGPEIQIGFKNQDFSSGEFTNPDPVLLVEIADTVSGINIAGDIGHKITMILDSESDNKIDLTDFFNYDENSYLRGQIEYQLNNLAEGEHEVTIKAWDNFNNSSTASTRFTVISTQRLVLRNVLNYPNPFSSSTVFTFEINQVATVRIKIYTLAGRLIRTLEGLPSTEVGFNHYPWDGLDQDGETLANGVYLYKIIAKTYREGNELQAEAVGKLVVIQ